MDESRRFDEKEFALILRNAAELQARESAHGPRGGMTLREIEMIAAEAGIDPKYLRQAAQNLTVHAPTVWERIVGPATSIHAQRTVSGEYDADALAVLVDAAQMELGRAGTARDALGGIEWKAEDSFGEIHVTARPRGGETRIQVSTDRRESAALLVSLLPVAGAVAGGIAGATFLPVPELAAVAGGLVAGAGAARGLWQTIANRWQKRVRVLLDRVVSATEASRKKETTP